MDVDESNFTCLLYNNCNQRKIEKLQDRYDLFLIYEQIHNLEPYELSFLKLFKSPVTTRTLKLIHQLQYSMKNWSKKEAMNWYQRRFKNLKRKKAMNENRSVRICIA